MAKKYKTLVLVLTTAPADERAEALADALIAERLAACVNIHHPMRSVFRWQGAVQHDDERQLVIKTTRDRVEALSKRIAELHSYELPELLVIPVEGESDAYAAWVTSEVGSSAAASRRPRRARAAARRRRSRS